MHIVPPTPRRFRLLSDDGSCYGPYSSLEALVRDLHISVVRSLCDSFSDAVSFPCRRFIVVGDDGDAVPVSTIMDVRRAIVPRKYSSFAGKIDGKDYAFRHGPVPGIRHGKGSSRGWLRHPKTTAERRSAAGHAADVKPSLVRGRRKHRVLISAWDDIPRSAERSWKRHRKTQWRQ